MLERAQGRAAGTEALELVAQLQEDAAVRQTAGEPGSNEWRDVEGHPSRPRAGGNGRSSCARTELHLPLAQPVEGQDRAGEQPIGAARASGECSPRADAHAVEVDAEPCARDRRTAGQAGEVEAESGAPHLVDVSAEQESVAVVAEAAILVVVTPVAREWKGKVSDGRLEPDPLGADRLHRTSLRPPRRNPEQAYG